MQRFLESESSDSGIEEPNHNLYIIITASVVSILLLILLLVIRNRYNARKLGREINKLNEFIRAADGANS